MIDKVGNLWIKHLEAVPSLNWQTLKNLPFVHCSIDVPIHCEWIREGVVWVIAATSFTVNERHYQKIFPAGHYHMRLNPAGFLYQDDAVLWIKSPMETVAGSVLDTTSLEESVVIAQVQNRKIAIPIAECVAYRRYDLDWLADPFQEWLNLYESERAAIEKEGRKLPYYKTLMARSLKSPLQKACFDQGLIWQDAATLLDKRAELYERYVTLYQRLERLIGYRAANKYWHDLSDSTVIDYAVLFAEYDQLQKNYQMMEDSCDEAENWLLELSEY